MNDPLDLALARLAELTDAGMAGSRLALREWTKIRDLARERGDGALTAVADLAIEGTLAVT